MAEFTPEETTKLVEALKELGVKPDLSDKNALKAWMENYGKTDSGTPASNTLLYSPKVSVFSGETRDTSFDLWLYEVECLVKEGSYSPETIKQAVRKSLRGEAAKVAMRLGTSATVEDLTTKLKGIYGTVDLGETLLGQFCDAQQRPGEDVSSWSCRLEDLFDKVKESGQVKTDAMPDLLRSRFWGGLKQPLKDASGHLFQSITDYDKLRIEMRRIEKRDMGKNNTKDAKSKGKEQCHSAVPTQENRGESNTEVAELKSMFHTLSTQVSKLQAAANQNQGQVRTDVGTADGVAEHANSYRRTYDGSNQGNQYYGRMEGDVQHNVRQVGQSRGRGRGRGRSRGRPMEMSYDAYAPVPFYGQSDQTLSFGHGPGPVGFGPRGPGATEPRYRYQYTEDGQPICARCGQIGHIQSGCRVILDHSKRHLNGPRPALGTERQGQGQQVPQMYP